MSLSKAIDEKINNQQEKSTQAPLKTTPSSSNSETDNITFEDVVEKLKKNVDISISTSGYVLEKIGKTLNDKNSSEILSILSKLSKSNKYEEIQVYLNELTEIEKKHIDEKRNMEAQTSLQTSQIKDEKQKDTKIEKLLQISKDLLFDSDELNRIQAIDIDGQVESVDEFSNRLEKYKKVIQTTQWFNKLEDNKKKIVLTNFDLLKDNLKGQEAKKLNFLNEKFNSLGSQIEKQKTGEVKINMGNGEIISFANQGEAFHFVEKLKEVAEKEFQSDTMNILEGLGNILAFPTKVAFNSVFIYPFNFARNISLVNLYNDYQKDASGAEWSFDVFVSLITLYSTFSYFETLYRRCFVDVLAITRVQKIPFTNKPIRLPDFEIEKDFYSNPENVDLRNEYIQRINALNYLEEQAKSISDPKTKIMFEKELQNVRLYLNINTDTFWLKAYSLQKFHYIPRRFFNVFINGIYRLRNKATSSFINRKGYKEELETGVKYVFEDGTLKTDGQNVSGAEGKEPTKNLKNIYNYINSRKDLSPEEKKSRIKRVEEFTKSLLTVPRGEDYIKGELIKIAKEGYLSKSEINDKIEKHLIKKYPFRGKNGTQNMIDSIRNGKLTIKEFISLIKPASLTSGDVMMFKFMNYVDNNLWGGNSEDLDKVFAKIDSGKTEIKYEYSGKKLVLIKDFTLGTFGKFGFSIPELTKLKNYGGIVSVNEIKDIIADGEDYGESIESVKDLIDSDISKNLEHIIDLSDITSEEEKIYENIINKLKKDIKDGKIKITTDEFKLEVSKIYLGYLPKSTILDIVNGHDYGTGIKKSNSREKNVKNFIEKVQTGKWIGKLDDLKDAMDELANGKEVPEKNIVIHVDAIIDEINEIGPKLFERSFKNPIYGLPLTGGNIDTKTISETELKLANFLHTLNSNPLNGQNFTRQKFDEFIKNINDGVDYKIEEYYKLLNNALDLNTNFTNGNISHRSDYLKMIGSEINNHIVLINNKLINLNISVDEKLDAISLIESKLGKPINSLTKEEMDILNQAGVQIDNLKKNINKVENERSEKQKLEKQKLEDIEKKRPDIIKKINDEIDATIKNVEYLENLIDDIKNNIKSKEDLNNNYKSYNLAFKSINQTKHPINIEFEESGDNFSKLEQGLILERKKLEELEISKPNRIEVEMLKLKDPKKYLFDILNNLKTELENRGLETSILDRYFSSLADNNEYLRMLENGTIKDMMENPEKIILLHNNKYLSLNTEITKTLSEFFAHVKKKGFKISR